MGRTRHKAQVGFLLYLFANNVLVGKISPHSAEQLDLLLGGEAGDSHLHHAPEAHLVRRDESMVVDVGEEAHAGQAVHAVRAAAVAGDRVSNVQEQESPLEARGKETTEQGEQRGKRGEKGRVE